MHRRIVRTLLLVAFAFAAPASLRAQTVEQPDGLPAEAREWLTEIQQIHAQLTQLQERALQDPALAARQDSLGGHIRTAMEAIDPTLPQRMGRIEEMEAQAAAAEAENNEAKLMELRAEAQQIEQQFFSAQQQALQQPDLAAEISAFQTALEAKILETDPEAPRLLARFQELEQKLAEVAGR